MSIIEPTREKEVFAFTFTLSPGLTKHEALNWFLQHRKPRLLELERYTYNTQTGAFHAFGTEKKQ